MSTVSVKSGENSTKLYQFLLDLQIERLRIVLIGRKHPSNWPIHQMQLLIGSTENSNCLNSMSDSVDGSHNNTQCSFNLTSYKSLVTDQLFNWLIVVHLIFSKTFFVQHCKQSICLVIVPFQNGLWFILIVIC